MHKRNKINLIISPREPYLASIKERKTTYYTINAIKKITK